jgi:hypothetical protein
MTPHYIRHRLSQIAMRIEEAEADAGRPVLAHQLVQKRGLSGAGLTDDIDMHEPVGLADAKAARPVIASGLADRGDHVILRGHAVSLAGLAPLP